MGHQQIHRQRTQCTQIATSSKTTVDSDLEEIESLLKTVKSTAIIDALNELKASISGVTIPPLSTTSMNGLTPESLNSIRSAARMGDFEKLQELISADMKGNELLSSKEGDFMGLTPLHWAVAAGNTDSRLQCVRFLIEEAGVDIGEPNRAGNTCLHYAASTRKVECMRLLLKSKPSIVDKQGESLQTALHMSAAKGDPECVSLCIDYKANVNAIDVNKDTPLHLAARKGSHECMEILIKAGADKAAVNVRGVAASEEKEAELINFSYE